MLDRVDQRVVERPAIGARDVPEHKSRTKRRPDDDGVEQGAPNRTKALAAP